MLRSRTLVTSALAVGLAVALGACGGPASSSAAPTSTSEGAGAAASAAAMPPANDDAQTPATAAHDACAVVDDQVVSAATGADVADHEVVDKGMANATTCTYTLADGDSVDVSVVTDNTSTVLGSREIFESLHDDVRVLDNGDGEVLVTPYPAYLMAVGIDTARQLSFVVELWGGVADSATADVQAASIVSTMRASV